MSNDIDEEIERQIGEIISAYSNFRLNGKPSELIRTLEERINESLKSDNPYELINAETSVVELAFVSEVLAWYLRVVKSLPGTQYVVEKVTSLYEQADKKRRELAEKTINTAFRLADKLRISLVRKVMEALQVLRDSEESKKLIEGVARLLSTLARDAQFDESTCESFIDDMKDAVADEPQQTMVNVPAQSLIQEVYDEARKLLFAYDVIKILVGLSEPLGINVDEVRVQAYAIMVISDVLLRFVVLGGEEVARAFCGELTRHVKKQDSAS